jgi:hypothetical protein
VLAEAEVAGAPEAHRELAALDGATDEARREKAAEEIGEQGDDVDSHGSPAA